MTVLVDTSVWSLALRRDFPAASPELTYLRTVLDGADLAVTTGVILQELLQGFSGPKAFDTIVERFATMPTVDPDREDYIHAARLSTACRRAGVQLGTIDALIARLCIRHDLILLTADRDFTHAAAHIPLRLPAT